jgi:DNA-directed RNA polymerase specialized sigma24 family protein
VAARPRVTGAIAHLTRDERVILVRAVYWGWSVQRIADQFGLSEEIVKLRLHDAARSLLGGGQS